MKTVRRILFGILVVVFLLLGAWIVFLNTMVEWIPEPANVRMQPSRPILREEDVDPESAFGLLRRACEQYRKLKPQDADRDSENEEWERLAWEPWTDDAFPVTRRILDAVGPALELARQALELPDAQVPTVMDVGTLLPYLPSTRSMARVLHASACRKMAAADAAGAVDNALTAIRLGNLLSRGGSVLNHLVDIACTGIGCGTLRLLCLRDALPDADALSCAAELLRIESGLEPVAEVLRHEWIVGDGTLQAFHAGRSGLLQEYGPDWASRPSGRAVMFLVGSTPRRSQETFRIVYSHLVSLAERGASPEELERFIGGIQSKARSTGWPLPQDPVGALYACMMINSTGRYVEKTLDRLVVFRGTGLVLAIRCHEERTGRPPASLEVLGIPDLVQRYADPFDPERPLRYVVRDDGAWLVYSVGPNAVDDGGTYPKPGRYDQRAYGPADAKDDGDIVFPSDEPEERCRIWEAERAEMNTMPGAVPGMLPAQGP